MKFLIRIRGSYNLIYLINGLTTKPPILWVEEKARTIVLHKNLALFIANLQQITDGCDMWLISNKNGAWFLAIITI
jgi:hypothetical protein